MVEKNYQGSAELIELTQEIDAMAAEDQSLRSKTESNNIQFLAMLEQIDRKNTKRMKEIVDDIGWPTISKVGDMASHNAWLLVQHADHDIEFQKYCLALLQDVVAKNPNDVSPGLSGFLEDRIMTKEAETQKFGTQMRRQPDGSFLPFPIIEIDKLDERRASLGMEPYAGYVEHFNQKKKRKNNA